MNLSILIPTFNFDCRILVKDLLRQLPEDGEIIVADDCSTEPWMKNVMNDIANYGHCRTLLSEKNLGRAGIRNKLADFALGEWLIFIDCDAKVANDNFIKNYTNAANGYDVICGGTGNFAECPSEECLLRYKYETQAEKALTLKKRVSQPYSQFTTFNFMARKSVFQKVRFDEGIHGYGHEDTAFGLQLQEHKLRVNHIDNKLIHTGLEPSPVYLKKTESALHSLSLLPEEIRSGTRLGELHKRLASFHLDYFAALFHRMAGEILKSSLCGRHPSLILFALYKLCFYCNEMRRNKTLLND